MVVRLSMVVRLRNSARHTVSFPASRRIFADFYPGKPQPCFHIHRMEIFYIERLTPQIISPAGTSSCSMAGIDG
jgi:hypothetical protein